MPSSALGLGKPALSPGRSSACDGCEVPLAPATCRSGDASARGCTTACPARTRSAQVGQAGDALKCKLQQEPEKLQSNRNPRRQLHLTQLGLGQPLPSSQQLSPLPKPSLEVPIQVLRQHRPSQLAAWGGQPGGRAAIKPPVSPSDGQRWQGHPSHPTPPHGPVLGKMHPRAFTPWYLDGRACSLLRAGGLYTGGGCVPQQHLILLKQSGNCLDKGGHLITQQIHSCCSTWKLRAGALCVRLI